MPAGANNPRKRGREVTAAAAAMGAITTTTGGITTAPTIHPFSMQSQAPQLIDLSQLHNNPHPSQPNVVSTGLRLSFGDQQQIQQNHQYQHQQQQQQQQQSFVSQSSPFLYLLPEDFAPQIKRQRDEIDQFLQAQVPIFLLFFWDFSLLGFNVLRR